MKDHSADLILPRTPAPRRRGVAAEGGATRRFSPLNAAQRAAVDAFCTESRSWALRQATRTYRHLPEELREQAVDQAMRELRTGAPAAVDRRTLHEELAFELTAALRRVHIGWCLNQSAALWREEGVTAPGPERTDAAPERLAAFIEQGLGGLERAVLQLEIGAGRDSRTVRAALRLGPRQYARHREEGLSKLRDAVTGLLAGHVCDQHVGAVVLAATGDRAAAETLAGGPARCRSCSREAQGLRRLLHERLALAPWPLVIKPAGVLAAKLGALGAVFGGKSAATGGSGAGIAVTGLGSGSVGSGTSVVTALIAAAAIATGTGAALHHDGPDRGAASRAAAAAKPAARPAARTAGATATAARRPRPAATGHTRHATRHRVAAHRRTATTQAPATTAPVTSAATPVVSAAPAVSAVPKTTTQTTQTVKDTVHDTTGKVQDTVDRVTQPIAPQVAQPVDDTLGAVQNTTDQLTGTVDNLLAPQK